MKRTSNRLPGVLLLATALSAGDPGEAIASRQAADGGTARVVPAKGRVTVRGIRLVSGGLMCQLAYALRNQTADFGVKVEWRADGAKVTSDGGEFSCDLQGQDALRGAEPCQFAVGGGRARTQVTCPADRVSAQRAGDGLTMSVEGCAGAVADCRLEADLEVSVSLR